MADDKKKPKLTLVKPTADGVAALYEKLTGKKPDLDKIREGLKDLKTR